MQVSNPGLHSQCHGFQWQVCGQMCRNGPNGTHLLTSVLHGCLQPHLDKGDDFGPHGQDLAKSVQFLLKLAMLDQSVTASQTGHVNAMSHGNGKKITIDGKIVVNIVLAWCVGCLVSPPLISALCLWQRLGGECLWWLPRQPLFAKGSDVYKKCKEAALQVPGKWFGQFLMATWAPIFDNTSALTNCNLSFKHVGQGGAPRGANPVNHPVGCWPWAVLGHGGLSPFIRQRLGRAIIPVRIGHS